MEVVGIKGGTEVVDRVDRGGEEDGEFWVLG